MTRHNLKIWPEFFDATERKVKTFEYRKDDRGFKVGDTVQLLEWMPQKGYDKDGHEIDGHFTERRLTCVITYILRDSPVIPKGYCVMSVIPVK